MVKKLLTLMLVGTVVVGMVGCGWKSEPETVNPNPPDSVQEEVDAEIEEIPSNDTGVTGEMATAQEILNRIWNNYAEEDQFSIVGGDYDNMKEGIAGNVNVTKGEDLDTMFGFPADKINMIDAGASMMHMMNQNTFTASCYHVSDLSGPGKAVNVETLAEDIKSNILNRQWLCGFPDILVIYSVETDYLVVAFGAEEAIATFESNLKEVHASATKLHQEDLHF